MGKKTKKGTVWCTRYALFGELRMDRFVSTYVWRVTDVDESWVTLCPLRQEASTIDMPPTPDADVVLNVSLRLNHETFGDAMTEYTR